MSFFESILVRDKKIPLWNYHYNRIQQNYNYLWQKKAPKESEILQKLEQLPFGNLKVKITFEAVFFNTQFEKIDLNDLRKKQNLTFYNLPFENILRTNIKFVERSFYENSLKFALGRGYDQSILVSEKNEIIETSYGNIYFIKDKTIYTPPLLINCVDGIFRKYIFDFFKNHTCFNIIEKNILKDDLELYESAFITTAIRGIVKVNNFNHLKNNNYEQF
jgi:branched-subunit amino acid aminotransferase/4-amino-4-deoxychorismate lyase